VEAEWKRLMRGLADSTLTRLDRAFAKKFAKAVQHLQNDPAHPGLQSHEIDALTARYGLKVFESYLENNTPGAARIFWVYGPKRHYITVIGLEPHPEDAKRQAYARVQLSQLPALRVALSGVTVNTGDAEVSGGEKRSRSRSRKKRRP
jgi:hypothetical protein